MHPTNSSVRIPQSAIRHTRLLPGMRMRRPTTGTVDRFLEQAVDRRQLADLALGPLHRLVAVPLAEEVERHAGQQGSSRNPMTVYGSTSTKGTDPSRLRLPRRQQQHQDQWLRRPRRGRRWKPSGPITNKQSTARCEASLAGRHEQIGCGDHGSGGRRGRRHPREAIPGPHTAIAGCRAFRR